MDRSPPSVANCLGNWLLATYRAVLSKPLPVPLRPPQESECLVLWRLTVETILPIVEHLSATDKIVLAQTCSQFHNILRQSTQTYLSASTLTALEHTDYLYRISRDNIDSWACDRCHAVHVFHPRDTPETTNHLVCPRSRTRVSYKERFFLIPQWPHHRHVHLALKLSRQQALSLRQSKYLANLLRNCHGVRLDSPRRPSLKGEYESFPRLVQGRFLLKVVQHFEDPMWASRDLFLDGSCLVSFGACTHQKLEDENLTSGWRHLRRRKDQRLRERNPQSYPRLPSEEIETAVETAFARMGEVVQGSCPQCPTDFTVQIWWNRATLCTWSDLGGEVPKDEKLLNAYRRRSSSSRYPYWSEGVEHEPGAVKALYEFEESLALVEDDGVLINSIFELVHYNY